MSLRPTTLPDLRPARELERFEKQSVEVVVPCQVVQLEGQAQLKSENVAHSSLVSESNPSLRKLRSLGRDSSSLRARTFLLSPSEEARFVASDIFAFLPRFDAAFAPPFFVLACIAPSLAACLKTLETQFSDFSSQSLRHRRARLFEARLFCLSSLVSIRLLLGLFPRTGRSRFAMTPMADEAESIILGTCWRMSPTIPSTLSTGFYNNLKLKFKSKK